MEPSIFIILFISYLSSSCHSTPDNNFQQRQHAQYKQQSQQFYPEGFVPMVGAGSAVKRQVSQHHQQQPHPQSIKRPNQNSDNPRVLPPFQPNSVTSSGYYSPENQRRPQLQPQHPKNNYREKEYPNKRPNDGVKLSSLEEYDEETSAEQQQPDRLTELMANSKFDCQGKKDGYYADDSLDCEVFHYCQSGGKHSWLCPTGFQFHQIHLICVPPSSDNQCSKSSNFHFVNDYLYKPVNQKEADQYNTSLRYADRFFPENSGGLELFPYHNNDDEERDEQPYQNQNQPRPSPQPRPHHPQQNHPSSRPHHQPAPQQNLRHRQQHLSDERPTPRQPFDSGPVFYSPESVNIPLSSRRPLPSNFRPSTQVVKAKQSNEEYYK